MTPPGDPVAALIALAEEVSTSRPEWPLGAWFRHGIQRFLNGIPLEQALGLAATAPGDRSARTRHVLSRRNRLLREACELAGGPARLAEALRRFQSRKWPVWRHKEQAPGHASELEQLLHAVHQVDPAPPSSAKQLSRICP